MPGTRAGQSPKSTTALRTSAASPNPEGRGWQLRGPQPEGAAHVEKSVHHLNYNRQGKDQRSGVADGQKEDSPNAQSPNDLVQDRRQAVPRSPTALGQERSREARRSPDRS